MQKKLIALAVAALAGSAFAQTNVTIYGVVDAGIAKYSSANNGHASTQVISSGLSTSRLGFKGVEDLGNGLKALFVLEYRLSNDVNTTIGGNFTNAGTSASGPARQQLLGLTGGFGTVAAGRLQTASYDWMVKYQTLVATAFDAANLVSGKGGFRVNTGVDARADNALAYISPSFGGLTLAVNHAKAVEQTAHAIEQTTTTANIFSADYTNGPLAVGLVNNRAVAAGVGATANQDDWALGASYNFGAALLKATYQTTKNKNGLVTASGDAAKRNKAYHVGVTVPFGAAALVASYAANNLAYTDASDNAKAWNLAGTYALSKRTTAYAGYARATNGSGAAAANAVGYGAGTVAPAGALQADASGKYGSSSVLAAGLAHSF